LCIDVLGWDHKTYSPPDILWMGIPCTLYPNASFKRSIQGGNILALKALEILEYFKMLNPSLLWAIENPYSSLLRKQPFMQGIPYKDVITASMAVLAKGLVIETHMYVWTYSLGSEALSW